MTPTHNAPGARQAALDILLRVECGAFASILLENAESGLADPRESRQLHGLVLGVLRRLSALDHALEAVSSRPVRRMDPLVRQAARIAAYELLCLDGVPPFAAVASGVEMVKRRRGRAAAGFANGVLRRVAERGRELLPPVAQPGDVAALALHQSHPRWWVERVVRRLGWDAAVQLLEADNRPAATVLRPNLARSEPQRVARLLSEAGCETRPGLFVPGALRVERGAVARSCVLADGEAWVQDEGSQLVPLLAGSAPVARIVDLCAAPGTKTVQLAENLAAGGLLVACDRHAGRLRRLSRALKRLDLAPAVSVLCADAHPGRSALRGEFQTVLLDAPCSGTGTLRRHPEIRWRLRVDEVEALASNQERLLDGAAELTARGGKLIYSVCSLEPEEGERVVARFLAARSGFSRIDPREGLPPDARRLVDGQGQLRTSPADGGLDGFFAAVLTRL